MQKEMFMGSGREIHTFLSLHSPNPLKERSYQSMSGTLQRRNKENLEDGQSKSSVYK